MRTKLTDKQKQQLDDLITSTILPALQEDICIPDMRDMKEDHPDYDQTWEDRMNVLYGEALNYLKKNIS